MWFAAAVGSAFIFGLAGWWMKVSQMQGGSSPYLLLGLYLSGTAGFGAHAALEHTLLPSMSDWRIWIAGMLIGAGSALGNYLFMKALECGPASLTSPLTNMNIILVVALGTMAYNERLTATEWYGVALLLLAVAFVSFRGKEKLAIVSGKWFAYVAISIAMFAVRNGGLKVTDGLGLASAPVLFVSYALSVLWFGVMARREAASGRAPAPLPPGRKIHTGGTAAAAGRIGIRWGLVAGLFSYGGLQLYAISLESGQANIVGPIFAANSLVVAAGAIVLYRERLTALQWAAFALTFAGLVLIRV